MRSMETKSQLKEEMIKSILKINLKKNIFRFRINKEIKPVPIKFRKILEFIQIELMFVSLNMFLTLN